VSTLEDHEQIKTIAGEGKAVMTPAIRLCICDENKGKKILLSLQTCIEKDVEVGEDMEDNHMGIDSFCNGEDSPMGKLINLMMPVIPAVEKEAEAEAKKGIEEEAKKKVDAGKKEVDDAAKKLAAEKEKKAKESGASGASGFLLIAFIIKFFAF
jgi:hypothetical protein